MALFLNGASLKTLDIVSDDGLVHMLDRLVKRKLQRHLL